MVNGGRSVFSQFQLSAGIPRRLINTEPVCFHVSLYSLLKLQQIKAIVLSSPVHSLLNGGKNNEEESSRRNRPSVVWLGRRTEYKQSVFMAHE